MELTKLGLILLLAIASANAFHSLAPLDKEVVYNWRALVKAGTHHPASFVSQLMIQGKIHLQANSNSTHVKISDLTHQLYNGVLDHVHEHEIHNIPVTQEVEDLQKVFKIVYDEHGYVMGIVTEEHEKEFSRNIKKAIASILQVDDSVVNKVHPYPHTFVTKEHSIYGHGDVDYTVIHHDDHIEVQKMHDMHDSHHMYQHLYTNRERVHCDAVFEDPLMHDSNRKYKIIHQDGHHIVKHISATGAIMYYPFQAKSDAQYILVNQTFELIHVVPIQEAHHVQGEHFEHDLTYHSVDEDKPVEARPDFTHGRHVINFDKMIPAVQQTLKDIVQYMHEEHIHTHEPNMKNELLIDRVERLLEHFTLEKLQEVHKTLSGEDLKVFHHILPLIGTRASILHIKHLVVNKLVDEEEAVAMLQHFPEHVIVPSTDLLKEVEDLMHLGDNIHWSVRKVAILSFGSLVHKSHAHMKKVQHNKEHVNHVDPHHVDVVHDVSQHFEKYVVEYVSQVRAAKDFKVQMAFLMGIMNMKHVSVVTHLKPIINGEWGHDFHLRFLSLMAMGPVVVEDPIKVMEILWPILSNREELTEMRIMAYYFIMESQPSHSRLTNIYWLMMTEPNEEVYHFHYTYVHTMMQSSDPCKEQMKVKLAQLMKFTHPPSHGLSFAQLTDFKDVNFGFSNGFQSYFVNTNHSQLVGIMTTSQQAHVQYEDYFVSLKVHGLRKSLDLSNFLVDFVYQKNLPKMVDPKGFHIEVVIQHHGNVINTFYFNEHNIHDLDHILDIFTKDSKSFTKEFLHINYHKHMRVHMPTDLGIPAIWAYLMPVVHQNKMTINKEVTNKITNVHIDNKYVNWIHYRHGLSFYNPISDAWHGINRVHTYDAVWPLRLDIAINTQQQSLQLSWKKHQDVHQDVAGLRSHVKQVVFLLEGNNGKLLTQSSPSSKQAITVSNGKDYRNDFTILHEDDLNTGHLWHVEVFDSERHVSNGSFQHLMYMFSQPWTKHFETPLSHLWLTYANWHQYALFLPRPSTHGVMVRVEPSHEHAVSNIDLSIRVNVESVNDENFYTPATKWSTRMTYAVKNKEQSLKMWDVNALVDMKAGHTVNNLKMHLTRIIPGQKDYKICIDGVKKWTDNAVSGHLNLAMSQTADGKCNKDDTVIDVTMTGQRSHEQDHERHVYGACQYTVPYHVGHYHTLHCLAAHTSLRHYIYNVKTTNVPTEFKKIFNQWWDHVKGHYITYYNYEDEHNEDIGEHNLKVDVVYPMQVKEVDVHVTTPNHVYKLTGVPTQYWRWFGVIPDSSVYSTSFLHSHSAGSVDHCVVHHDRHHLNHHQVHDMVPNDWTLYVGDATQNPQKAVFIKHVANDKIAVKIVDHSHTIEMVPHEDSHQITVDGQVVPEEELHHEDWVHYHIFTHEVTHPVAVMLPKSEFHVEYNGHHVVILVPKVDEHQMHGHCYSDH